MKGSSHFVCAALSGAVTIAFFCHDNILDASCLMIGSAIGGLMPDIDIPTSAVGKILRHTSKLINKLFGHRTITHSGLWLFPLLILCIKTSNAFLWGYTIGFFSHLLSDTLTAGGVAWLYPLDNHRIKLTPLKSGKHDVILTIIVIMLYIAGYAALAYIQKENILPFK